MKRFCYLFLLAATALTSCERFLISGRKPAVYEGKVADPEQVMLSTQDVDLFWEAYDGSQTATDQTAHWQRTYLDRLSPTVKSTLNLGGITAAVLAKATSTGYRQFFPSVRTLMKQAVRQQQPAIRQALRDLKRVYPEASFPALYFGVGLFNNGGKSLPTGIYIGAEYYTADSATITTELRPDTKNILFKASQLPIIVAHEMAHQQQRYRNTGSTLLSAAIGEGSADFLTKLATGAVATGGTSYAFGLANERAVWQQFSKEMNSTNWRNWLYNGNSGNANNYPADMGYFVGFRICEAYYNRAADKQQALRDMLQTTDFSGFLAQSGYADLWK